MYKDSPQGGLYGVEASPGTSGMTDSPTVSDFIADLRLTQRNGFLDCMTAN